MKKTLTLLCTCLTAAFWGTAFILKMLNPALYRHEMRLQHFPNYLADILVWLLPGIQLLILCLLVSYKWRWLAFLLSNLLLTAFNIYIGLVISGYFSVIPCSCAGLLAKWEWQALLNLGMTAISVAGMELYKKHYTKPLEKGGMRQRTL